VTLEDAKCLWYLGNKMNTRWGRQTGFTIVELLIVVVVIAILAAITIVSYNGITNRANDTAVQSDLRNLGGKTLQFMQLNGDALPSVSDLVGMGIKTSTGAYGAHYTPTGSNGYNLIQCLNNTTKAFAYVAASKSGKVYVYRDGSVTPGVGPLTTYTSTCANNGVPANGAWLFSNGVWQL